MHPAGLIKHSKQVYGYYRQHVGSSLYMGGRLFSTQDTCGMAESATIRDSDHTSKKSIFPLKQSPIDPACGSVAVGQTTALGVGPYQYACMPVYGK